MAPPTPPSNGEAAQSGPQPMTGPTAPGPQGRLKCHPGHEEFFGQADGGSELFLGDKLQNPAVSVEVSAGNPGGPPFAWSSRTGSPSQRQPQGLCSGGSLLCEPNQEASQLVVYCVGRQVCTPTLESCIPKDRASVRRSEWREEEDGAFRKCPGEGGGEK